jgi:hypothetical protein
MNDREKLIQAAARGGWEVRQAGRQLIFTYPSVPNRVVTVRFGKDGKVGRALDGVKNVGGDVLGKVLMILNG